jgi:hypothetical protein
VLTWQARQRAHREWRLQRQRRDKARRVGNEAEEDDAQRRLAAQERILDELNPAWKDDAYAKGKDRILPPPPPPAGLTHAATASRLPKILDVCPE